MAVGIDLSITKTDGSLSTTPGAAIAYTLSYTNGGSQNATGVVLTETVPANATFNAGGSTAGWVCVPNGNAGSTTCETSTARTLCGTTGAPSLARASSSAATP